VTEYSYFFLPNSFSNLITKLKDKRPLGRPTNIWDGHTCEDVTGFCDYVDEINVGIIKYRQFTYKVILRGGRLTIVAVEK